jgi:hypothetical protein
MNIRWRLGLPLVLTGAVLVAMLMAGGASATHPRPKGATPMRWSVVVAYKQCTAPNRQHGAPLAQLSCNPPVQASNFLTVGTADAWAGTLSKSVASVRLDVKTTSPEDVLIKSSGTDIRCVGNSVPGFCANANTDNPNVPDYAGELNGNTTIRITDHFNGPIGACGACTDPATVSDLQFPVTGTCATTADGTIGSTCTANTSANGTVPGSVVDNKRGNVEIQTLLIEDGGQDGTAITTPNTLFGTQGIFIP